MRDASRKLLSDITEFLKDLQTLHPAQSVEDRNSMLNRQKLLSWLEDALGVLCETLADLGDRPVLTRFGTSICESVDSVLLSLIDAMESGDRMTWDIARQLTGDRGAMMCNIRVRYLEMDPPLRRVELINVLLITNSVEETFFLLSKLEKEFNAHSGVAEHVPHA